MSVLQSRGGYPVVFRESIDATGREIHFGTQIWFLKARNKGLVPIKMYFSQTDYDNDIRYVEIPIVATETPHGEWEGPVELKDPNYSRVWLAGDGGASEIELVGFQRRG